MNKLIYNIDESPRTIKEWILYPVQQVLAVFVATVLIANICDTPISACLVGACVGTLLYQVLTRGKSPMFISSCGATVSAVCGALAIGDGGNYLAVIVGGAVIAAVYGILALVIKLKGVGIVNKLFPATIIGAITIVIGLNLATFIPTYVQIEGAHSNVGVIVAIVTMLVVAVSSHYFKGFWKTVPFLIGLAAGYVVSTVLTLTGVAPIVDFGVFKGVKLFALPDFAWNYWNWDGLTLAAALQAVVYFLPVALCSCMEHISDHKVLSNIVETDLLEEPGLHRTLLGDGLASLLGTVVCGLPNTSYGESIATVGFSKVASRKVITVAALITGAMAFIGPVQAFVASIPACVFGGCAMVLYGYIAASGLKTLYNAKVDLEDNKNLIVVSVILTVGVSGIWLFNEAFAGVALAMILGLILNVVLKEKSCSTKA